MNHDSQALDARKKMCLYPKSVTNRIAKLEHDPKFYRSILHQKKYLAFGDSFVNMFMHVQNAFHIKLKGKSLKGLAKSDKQDKREIQKWVKASKKETQLIFNFGQVDLNLVRYYKLIHKQDYAQQTFQDYVNWISTLNKKTTIIGIFASPIIREDIINVLDKYKTTLDTQFDEQQILDQFDRTEDTRERWNNLLEKACKQKQIRFINLFKHHQQIDESFIDQNPLTIHLRYLPCIEQVKKYIPDLKIDYKRAQQVEVQYEIIKAKRYQENMRLEEQRKRLESQQTKGEQNGSPKDESSELESQGKGSNKKYSEDEDNQKNSSKSSESQTQNVVDENESFIKSLQIPEISSVSTFFEKIFYSDSDETVQSIVQKIVQKGMQLHTVKPIRFQQLSLLVKLLKQIECLKTQENLTASKASKLFLKSFVICLQKKFQEKIKTDDDDDIENLINFIMFLHISQENLKFTMISTKIILRIIKQLIASLFRRFNSKDRLKKKKMLTEYNCLYKIQKSFKQKMIETYQKQQGKNRIKESQALIKIMEIFFQSEGQQEQSEEVKQQQFQKLIFEEYPYEIFSMKIFSNVMRFFEVIIMIHHFDNKLKRVGDFFNQIEIVHPTQLDKKIEKLDKQFNNKIMEIQQKQSEKKSQSCCYCGCVVGKEKPKRSK